MDFPYKTIFANANCPIKALSVTEEQKTALASLKDVANFLPKDIDFESNGDLLGFSANAAVANSVNLNDDGITGNNLVEVAKNFIGKFCDLEHKRNRIVGYITNYGFSKFGTDEVMTEEEARNTTEPFNIVLGGIIWRLADKDFAAYIEESSNPESENFESVSTSWEVGFSENNLVLLPKGKSLYKEGLIITSEDKDFDKISQCLRANGGDGTWGEFRVCRDIILPALPLGIGFTENPAASVKGVATMINKTITAEIEEHSEDCDCDECKQEKEALSKVDYKDKELYQRVRKDADDKFGAKNSYVKNLWVLKEYKKRGGKTKFSGKKPNSDEIKKSVKSAEIHAEMDEYQDEVEAAEKVKRALNKPFRTPGGPKKFGVYVKNDKGNIVLVRFGDPGMEIKRDDPERRKNFRARHNCDQKKDKTTPGYWSCKMWSKKPVSDIA
jgi:hypothetical protein